VKTITVHVPEKTNLEQAQKLLAGVLGKVGHPNCVSGFNINFQSVVDPAERILAVDKQLNVIEVG
jgi:hypothetical protein